MEITEGDAIVPVGSLSIHTFVRILLCPNWDLLTQIDILRDKNGGQLVIECYSAIGLDGSSSHPIYKKRTDASLLKGKCIVSSLVPLQVQFFKLWNKSHSPNSGGIQ